MLSIAATESAVNGAPDGHSATTSNGNAREYSQNGVAPNSETSDPEIELLLLALMRHCKGVIDPVCLQTRPLMRSDFDDPDAGAIYGAAATCARADGGATEGADVLSTLQEWAKQIDENGALAKQGAQLWKSLKKPDTTPDNAKADALKLAKEIKKRAASTRKPTPPKAEKTRASTRGVATAAPFNLTDTGNAERFIARHGENVRFCEALGGWHIWDGTRWQLDRAGDVQRLAKETIRSIYREAADVKTDAARRDVADWAKKSEARNRRADMLALAQYENGAMVLPEKMDCDRWVFNCKNGTLDLRTGALRPHQRADLLTKIAPVAYDADAQCPTFLRFLTGIMGGDADLVGFVQRAIGYALTGDDREQCFFILHGAGSNGKSTLLDILRELLGDYATHTKSDTFTVKRAQGPNNDVARLRGARFVTAVESDEGKRLAESQIKEMTGGDPLTARFLFKEFFDFKPDFKIFFATNHKPEIKGTDDGIWRRVRLIPFDVRFWNPDKGESGAADLRADKSLPEKLRAELPGIFAWAVQGCLNWQRDGLPAPKAVIAATDAYREEQDELAGFLSDACIIGEKCRVTAKELGAVYETWCDENGVKAISSIALSKRLRERGFDKNDTKKARGWLGIGLKTDAPEGDAFETVTHCDANLHKDSSKSLHGKSSCKNASQCVTVSNASPESGDESEAF